MVHIVGEGNKKMRFSRLKPIIIVLIFFSLLITCYAHNFESESLFGIEEPEEYRNPNINANKKVIDNKPIIPKPVGGYGFLNVVVESIEALNHSVISKKAERVELWLGHLLLYRLNKDDLNVRDYKTSRIFEFPSIELKTGYHFISIRLFKTGFLWKQEKYHEEIYQVGIHEGKRTTLRKKIPFLNW